MRQPNWDRIQEIYHAATAVARSERSAFIVSACDNNPVLISEVNALLEVDDSSSGFLKSPVIELGLKDCPGSDSAGASSADNLVGTIINERYRIERELGYGGMGQVYFALDLRLNRRAVVIKILSQALLQHSYARQKFKQEAEALSRIHHAGVVDVLDTGELGDGRPYIVMQYVDGETLRSQIPTEGMNLKRAASILKQIGDALERALLDGKAANGARKWLAMIGGSLIVLALLAFGIYKYRSSTPEPGFRHSFTYWLTVQKMRDGKDHQGPFKSNDDEVFESGDKFRLNVLSPEPGYLYVINEGPPEPNNTSFTMIYPRQATNNGSATIGANQSVQSDWIIFRGPPGADNFWIIWSASPVSELESAKNEAFKHPNGGLTDPAQVTVKEYLKAKQSEIKVKTTRYKASETAVVRGTGDMLLTLAQFKHR